MAEATIDSIVGLTLLAAMKAERTVIFRMPRSQQIGSQTADKLVHELDLLDARYEA
jgi:hypothetical protein